MTAAHNAPSSALGHAREARWIEDDVHEAHPARIERMAATFSVRRPDARVTVIRDAAGMAPFWNELQELADTAIEPNAFYEPTMLKPALAAFGTDRLRLVLIHATASHQRRPLLCGFFPFEFQRRYRRLPVPTLRSWLHMHSFLGTPLIRPGFADGTIARVLDWAASPAAGARLVELRQLATDGPVYLHVLDQMHARGLTAWVADWHVRALLTHASSSDDNIREALGAKKHKELLRVERRLREQGQLTFDELTQASDLDRWVDQFLALEAKGWKGRAASAMLCEARQAGFFRASVHAAHARRRLTALAMRLDGRPIAMKFNFLAAGAAFAFKIAYAEDLARFSPGVLLEIENIRRFDRAPHLKWMDSCADPHHPMINHLWSERRPIQTLVFSATRRRGAATVATLPLLRWLATRWRTRHHADLPETQQ